MSEDPTAESLKSQVDRLAKFITKYIPGEPSRSEGAIDTAIRLLRDFVHLTPSDARKIWSALMDADHFFEHRDEMNAAIHLSTPIDSPLASKVRVEKDRLERIVMKRSRRITEVEGPSVAEPGEVSERTKISLLKIGPIPLREGDPARKAVLLTRGPSSRTYACASCGDPIGLGVKYVVESDKVRHCEKCIEYTTPVQESAS